MFKRVTVLLLFVTLLGTGLGQIIAQDGDRELRFFLTFVPNIQFSPLYVALENGYFTDAGIDLMIEHGDEDVGVDLIAAGEIQFGMISGEQIILARASGRPVVFIYEWFQRYPVGIVVPEGSDIETVRDLAGRKVGIPGRFGASYSGLTALLAANDMQESDLRLEPIGFAAPDVMCAGGVEASVIYVNNEPLQIQQRASAGECGEITGVDVIRVADAADMVSNGITTNEKTINEDPDLVHAVVAAFDSGLRDVINNTAQAYLLSLDYVENLPVSDAFHSALEAAAEAQAEFLATNPDREAVAMSRAELLDELAEQFDDQILIQFRVLLATIELWDADRLGYTDAESWELTLEIVESMQMTSGPVDLEGAFTNEFLPPGDEEG